MNRRPTRRRRFIAAFLAGLLFGTGLIVGGMTRPSKIIGFLDVAGAWDPSLALVMVGSIAVFMPLFRIIVRRSRPIFDAYFALPTRSDLDGRLVVGASLFGIGWGLAGYCPGPALTALASFAPTPLLFVGSMLLGFGLVRAFELIAAARASSPGPADSARPAPQFACEEQR